MGLKEYIHGIAADFTSCSFLSWVWSRAYDQNALTSITNETHSWHCHSSVDGTAAHMTWTHWQMYWVANPSKHSQRENEIPLAIDLQITYVGINVNWYRQMLQLYTKVKNKFLITNSLCKWQKKLS